MSKTDKKKDLSSTLCVAPWAHLSLDPSGYVHNCCKVSPNNELGDLNKSSIEEIHNSEKNKKIRQSFLEGKRPEICQTCYKVEETGGRSLRHILNWGHNEILQKVINDPQNHQSYARLESLEMRFSNLCNLKCRTCEPLYSTRWYKEGAELDFYTPDKPLQAFESQEVLKDFLDKVSKDLKQVHISGGEPLLDENHYFFLRYLNDRNLNDIELIYNSNATKLSTKDYNFIEEISNFKKVSFAISLDAAKETSSHLRSGTNWKSLKDNIDILLQQNNISCFFHITISVFNVFHVTELVKEIMNNGWPAENIVFNYVQTPLYYNPEILPKVMKDELTHHYNNFIKKEIVLKYGLDERASKITKQFKDLLNSLHNTNEDKKQLKILKQVTSYLDNSRKENTSEVFSHLKEILAEKPLK